MTRWTQPLKIRLQGDEEGASLYIGRARKELAILETEMKKKGWKSSERQVSLPDNTSLRIGIIYGQAFADIVSGPVKVPGKEEEPAKRAETDEKWSEELEWPDPRTLIFIGNKPAGYSFQLYAEAVPGATAPGIYTDFAVWDVENACLYPLVDEDGEDVGYPLRRARLLELFAMPENGKIDLESTGQCRFFDLKPTVKTGVHPNSRLSIAHLHESAWTKTKDASGNDIDDYPFNVSYSAISNKVEEFYLKDEDAEERPVWQWSRYDARSAAVAAFTAYDVISEGRLHLIPLSDLHYEIWCSGDFGFGGREPIGCYYQLENYHDDCKYSDDDTESNMWITHHDYTCGSTFQPKVIHWHSIFPDQWDNGLMYPFDIARQYIRFPFLTFKTDCTYGGYIDVSIRTNTTNPKTYTEAVRVNIPDPLDLLVLAKDLKAALQTSYNRHPNNPGEDIVTCFYIADGMYLGILPMVRREGEWFLFKTPAFSFSVWEMSIKDGFQGFIYPESGTWTALPQLEFYIDPNLFSNLHHPTYFIRKFMLWMAAGSIINRPIWGDGVNGHYLPNVGCLWKHGAMCGLAEGPQKAYAFEFGIYQKATSVQNYSPQSFGDFRFDFRYQYKSDALKESRQGITDHQGDDQYHREFFSQIPGMVQLARFVMSDACWNTYALYNHHMRFGTCMFYTPAELAVGGNYHGDVDDHSGFMARFEPVPCFSVCEVKRRVIEAKQIKEEVEIP